MSTLIHPADLNLPPKFSTWRTGQWESILAAADAFDAVRFIASNDPTGSGKSVKAVAIGQYLGVKTRIYTATKALQSQYSKDFVSTGIADVRGRVNYPCTDFDNCANGRLLGCQSNKSGDCQYANDLTHFLDSDLGITNYSYALSSRVHSEGLGPCGLLVLDEAHDAVQELSSALEVHLNHSHNAPFYSGTIPHPPIGKPLPWYMEWAKQSLPAMEACLTQMKAARNRKMIGQADSLLNDLKRVAAIREEWIVDDSNNKETVFAPLWPTSQAKSILFDKAERVMLMSATIVPKTLQLLDISEEESKFISSPFAFPPHRSPIYLFGADKIDHKTTDAQYEQQLGRMDTLISRRLDRKGIIHTVSYARQQFIKERSEYSNIMLAPRSNELARAIEVFRSSPPPLILVSPAITTGYDFPMTDAEYQFIVKVPFIDLRGPIMKARSEDDPEYAMYLTIQTLVQMCGRLMRGPDDSSETFILDKHINWLLLPANRGGKWRHLFPSWFLKLIQWPNGQPQPPAKLPPPQQST